MELIGLRIAVESYRPIRHTPEHFTDFCRLSGFDSERRQINVRRLDPELESDSPFMPGDYPRDFKRASATRRSMGLVILMFSGFPSTR